MKTGTADLEAPRRVLAIANNFPSRRFPERGVFVMNALMEMGRTAHVEVIAPLSWISELKRWRYPAREIDYGSIKVHRPLVTLVPMRLPGLERAISAFNENRFTAAVRGCVRRDGEYEFIYAHFLPSGRAALRISAAQRSPVLLGLGESDPWDYDKYYGRNWIKELTTFGAIICASRRNYDYLVGREPSLEQKLHFVPNGVNTRAFCPRDQQECRRVLGLPRDEKIALFCGHFDSRKGPLRVLEAVRRLGILGVFLGSNGPDHPSGDGVLFAGSVPNAELPMWYNAADVFVLPSLSEGMSNAMLEALACGLPLVVADREFNTDFLNPAGTRFVDPMDVSAIADAIRYCLEPANNVAMRAANRVHAHNYGLDQRVRRIFEIADGLVRGT